MKNPEPLELNELFNGGATKRRLFTGSDFDVITSLRLGVVIFTDMLWIKRASYLAIVELLLRPPPSPTEVYMQIRLDAIIIGYLIGLH